MYSTIKYNYVPVKIVFLDHTCDMTFNIIISCDVTMELCCIRCKKYLNVSFCLAGDLHENDHVNGLHADHIAEQAYSASYAL
jgi:hypothetical protein